MSERILVFGGTFDPPHRAHSELPPLVAETLGCRRIVYVPAALNPLKTDHPPTAAEHRLAMLRLAIVDVPGAEISTIELDRSGPSYMVETLEALGGQLEAAAELRLLIGSDQALEFHRWKSWRRILQLATPAVMVREPLDEATYSLRIRETYPQPEAQRWLGWAVDVPRIDTCATKLRRRLAAGEEVGDLVSPAVGRYIREYGLYQSAAR